MFQLWAWDFRVATVQALEGRSRMRHQPETKLPRVWHRYDKAWLEVLRYDVLRQGLPGKSRAVAVSSESFWILHLEAERRAHAVARTIWCLETGGRLDAKDIAIFERSGILPKVNDRQG